MNTLRKMKILSVILTSLSGVLFMVVVIFLLLKNKEPSIAFLCGLFFTWVFILLLIQLICFQIQSRKIFFMLNNCHVKEFIEANISLIEKMKNINVKRNFYINLTAGYLSAGHEAYAKQVFDQIEQINQLCGKRLLPPFQFVYTNNLAGFYLHTNNLEKASQEIEKMKWMLEYANMTKKQRERFTRLYHVVVYCLRIANGDYEGAEDFFKQRLASEDKMLYKVSSQYTLGLIYQHTGKPEEAKVAFTYAIENGGDTRYVGEAKYQLTQMDKVAINE